LNISTAHKIWKSTKVRGLLNLLILKRCQNGEFFAYLILCHLLMNSGWLCKQWKMHQDCTQLHCFMDTQLKAPNWGSLETICCLSSLYLSLGASKKKLFCCGNDLQSVCWYSTRLCEACISCCLWPIWKTPLQNNPRYTFSHTLETSKKPIACKGSPDRQPWENMLTFNSISSTHSQEGCTNFKLCAVETVMAILLLLLW